MLENEITTRRTSRVSRSQRRMFRPADNRWRCVWHKQRE